MDFVDNTGERVRIFLFFVENIIFNYFKRESLYISSTSVIKGHPDSISKKKTLSFNLLYYEKSLGPISKFVKIYQDPRI